MCIVLYIYKYPIRCAKCGVPVCKASMLDYRGAICHRYMCIRPTMTLAKFGVAVLQAFMLDWGVSLPWVFVHCAISETYLV